MLEIYEILVDYESAPSGVGREVHIGWILKSDLRNTRQSSYRLVVSDMKDFSHTVYDSGAVESEESAHIKFMAEFEDITRYYVRVQVVDNHGLSAQAESSFVTAYASPEGWRGEFISAESDEDAGESFGTLLRREFEVGGEVESAYAVCTAHGLYEAYLNGEKIGEDFLTPGWTSYNTHLRYQIYDVSHMLRPGRNAVGVMLGAGWYKGKMSYNLNRNHYGRTTSFSGCIIINYADGTQSVVETSRLWRGSRSGILFSEIYDGETFDARLEPRGWSTPGFDDSGWEPVSTEPGTLAALTPTIGLGVRATGEYTPQLITTPAGEKVLDFRQNITGWCRFTIDNAPTGSTAELRFFETLDAKGNVYTDNLRTAKQTVTYICAGGHEIFRPHFTYQGFRYAQIISWPTEYKAEDFTALCLHTDMRETGDFKCGEPLVEQLQQNIRASMKGNFLDIPTDCPQRDERLGWTGDVQIFCGTALFLMNARNFFSKWLRDVEADQTAEGAVSHVVPDIITGKSDEDWLTHQGCSGASGWADVNIVLPWRMYLAFGDTDTIRSQYGSMKRWIDFMSAHSDGGCGFEYMLQFGDWVALDAQPGSYFGATPTSFTSSAYYCLSTRLFSKMASIIGRTEDAEHYGTLADRLRSDFISRWFDKCGRLSVDTQTAHILALCFDLVPEKFRSTAAAHLTELLDREGGHLVTGFLGTPYFCHALSDNGYTERAYDLLLREEYPGWLYQVKQGATTVWEHWDGMKPDGSMWSPDMNSFNHYAYGSVGDWLYENAGGLRPNEDYPGYKRFTLRPLPDSRLGYVRLRYRSVYGEIVCNWSIIEENRVSLYIRVPVNTEAYFVLPGCVSLEETDGIEFELCDNEARAKVGSGGYQIVYKLK